MATVLPPGVVDAPLGFPSRIFNPVTTMGRSLGSSSFQPFQKRGPSIPALVDRETI
jgi:hypothetical protein